MAVKRIPYTGNPSTLKLQFTHLPTGEKVSFQAYLENLADLYTSNWIAEDVYGRMDPITTFVNTRRAVSISWNVPAESFDDAKVNLQNINKLMSFLYPLYASSKAGGATAINQGPLMRLEFGNLIRSANGGGLLGYVNGFTFDPRVENGMFYSGAEPGGGTVGVEYYPKTVLLNCEFNVLHEHELGFKKHGNTYKFRSSKLEGDKKWENFPYFSSPVTAPPSNNSAVTPAPPKLTNPTAVATNTQTRQLFGPNGGDPDGNPLA